MSPLFYVSQLEVLVANQAPASRIQAVLADLGSDEYRKINPLGMVPALSDGTSRIMTQADAILKYLAAKFPDARLGSEPGLMAEFDLDEALAFLTGSDAQNSARPETRLAAPEAYRAGARISLRSMDDAPLAEVEIGLSTVSALAAVRTGNVYRVYPLDRLPKLVARVMQSSPAINPPVQADGTPDQNK